jgi:hypothetical protein
VRTSARRNGIKDMNFKTTAVVVVAVAALKRVEQSFRERK